MQAPPSPQQNGQPSAQASSANKVANDETFKKCKYEIFVTAVISFRFTCHNIAQTDKSKTQVRM